MSGELTSPSLFKLEAFLQFRHSIAAINSAHALEQEENLVEIVIGFFPAFKRCLVFSVALLNPVFFYNLQTNTENVISC